MFRVCRRRLRQFQVSRRVPFGQRRFEHRTPGGRQGGPADRGPTKVQHAGGQEDENPGVDDGVDGDEAEGNQVQAVRLALPRGVDVHPDLRDGQRGGVLNT